MSLLRGLLVPLSPITSPLGFPRKSPSTKTEREENPHLLRQVLREGLRNGAMDLSGFAPLPPTQGLPSVLQRGGCLYSAFSLPPGGRTAFVQEQTDQRASALLVCWSWPWPSSHQGPRPLSPLSPASCRWLSLPALDTVSTHSPEAELKEKQKELPGSPWLWPAPSYQD